MRQVPLSAELRDRLRLTSGIEIPLDHLAAAGQGAETKARHHFTSRVTRRTSSIVVMPASTLAMPS